MFLSRFKKFVLGLMALATIGLASSQAVAQTSRSDYLLGPGDVLRIQVFQSQDLTFEARMSESGVISYPLLGVVKLAGLSPQQAENLIATRLREGRFLQNPQVTLNVLQFRSQQVSVLGNVANPGRYPLETTGMRLSEILSVAGGVNETGSNNVLLMTTRNVQHRRPEQGRGPAGRRHHLRQQGPQLLRLWPGPASGPVCARPRHDRGPGRCQGRWSDPAWYRPWHPPAPSRG